MIADTLHVEPDTIMIPFSAETKQGREEIWELIDSLVLPEEVAENTDAVVASSVETTDDAKGMAVTMDSADGSDDKASEKQRKPRWKATGKETAKKTKKLQEKKATKKARKPVAKSKK